MKRTPLKPGTKRLTRKTPMSPPMSRIAKRNGKRAKKRHERDFGDKGPWVRTWPCCACGERRGIHAHHARSRGAGGHAEALTPLCPGCHGLVHQVGVESFRLATGVDLMEVARELELEWQSLNREAA